MATTTPDKMRDVLAACAIRDAADAYMNRAAVRAIAARVAAVPDTDEPDPHVRAEIDAYITTALSMTESTVKHHEQMMRRAVDRDGAFTGDTVDDLFAEETGAEHPGYLWARGVIADAHAGREVPTPAMVAVMRDAACGDLQYNYPSRSRTQPDGFSIRHHKPTTAEVAWALVTLLDRELIAIPPADTNPAASTLVHLTDAGRAALAAAERDE